MRLAAILLDVGTRSDCEMLIERIIESISEALRIEDSNLSVTTSLGVTRTHNVGEGPKTSHRTGPTNRDCLAEGLKVLYCYGTVGYQFRALAKRQLRD